jgi:hypothetical protein
MGNPSTKLKRLVDGGGKETRTYKGRLGEERESCLPEKGNGSRFLDLRPICGD